MPTPTEARAQLPRSASEAALVNESRRHIQEVLEGRDPRRLVIIGPCSIHDEDAALEYAARLAQLREEVKDMLLLVMRVYFEKPRSGPGWKGFINDPRLDGSCRIGEGLLRARRLLRTLAQRGMPAATEVLDPHSAPYLSDLVAWSAIGARTSESQLHREVASGLESPTGFKNSVDGRLETAVEGAKSAARGHRYLGIDGAGRVSVIATQGNRRPHVILRGGTSGPNYDSGSIEQCERLMVNADLHPAVIVDCSHANSGKDPEKQPGVLSSVVAQMAAGRRSLRGVMLESHLHAGNQKLSDPARLRYGVSVTDGCLDWERSAECVRAMHDALRVAPIHEGS